MYSKKKKNTQELERDVSTYDVSLTLASVFPQKQRYSDTHVGFLRSHWTTSLTIEKLVC